MGKRRTQQEMDLDALRGDALLRLFDESGFEKWQEERDRDLFLEKYTSEFPVIHTYESVYREFMKEDEREI